MMAHLPDWLWLAVDRSRNRVRHDYWRATDWLRANWRAIWLRLLLLIAAAAAGTFLGWLYTRTYF